MLTGYYDGLNTEFDLPANSLAAHLRSVGYQTIGIAANGNLSPRSMNVCKPFDIYHCLFDELIANREQILDANREQQQDISERYQMEMTDFIHQNTLNDADWVFERLRQSLPTNPERPIFLFLNFMDAHDPYVPPMPFYDPSGDPVPPRFYSDLRARPDSDWRSDLSDPERLRELAEKLEKGALGREWMLSGDLDEQQLELYKARYEASIHYLDSRMKDLVDLLKERGIYERCILVFTSDHGEAFGEGDFLTHSLQEMGDPEATRHIPLMIVPQDKTLEGPIIISDEVSIADVMPTIEDLLGIEFEPRPGPRYGRSLAEPLRAYSTQPERPVSMEFEVGRTGSVNAELDRRLKSLGYTGE